MEMLGNKKRKIKKVVKALKKASKAHAGQAKILKGFINGGSAGENSMVRQAQRNYTGSYISGDLGGVKVANPSYQKYYKGLV